MRLAILLLLWPLTTAAQSVTPSEQAKRDQTRKVILAQELSAEVKLLQSAIYENSEPAAANHRANIAALAVEMKITVPKPAFKKTRTALVARWCDAFCSSRRSATEGLPE